MNLLVTGGAGFIGSHLVDELVKQGHKIKIIDNLSTGRKEYLNPGAEFFESDIRDFEKIRPVFDGVEMVFHLAAQARIQPSIANPRESNGNNIDGTYAGRLFESLFSSKIRRRIVHEAFLPAL